MNTQPTPKLDVWEAYCDECYYHMWRLRRKTERGWYDGFHIHTGEEAKGLCETLNKLERELNEAREESIRWQSIAEGRGRTDDDEQCHTCGSTSTIDNGSACAQCGCDKSLTPKEKP